MAEINWTVVTYLVVGVFALAGFYRGWWKEAFTTFLLVILIFLLKVPGVAEWIVERLNDLLNITQGFLPEGISSFLGNVFGVSNTNGVIQANPTEPGTWLLFLLLFVLAAVVLSALLLPHRPNRAKQESYFYEITPMGSILGGIVGGLNGFIIINLVREYLDGRNLPGGGTSFPTEVSAVGGAGMASSGVTFQATDLPGFTVLDGALPWIFIAIGLLIFVAAIKSRIRMSKDKDGFRKVDYVAPLGYDRWKNTKGDGGKGTIVIVK